MSAFRGGLPGASLGLGGLRIVESAHLVIGPFEDWSQVRSPGRARRRRRQGHPQRIRIYYKPNPNFLRLPDGTIVAHPDVAAELRRATPARSANA